MSGGAPYLSETGMNVTSTRRNLRLMFRRILKTYEIYDLFGSTFYSLLKKENFYP